MGNKKEVAKKGRPAGTPNAFYDKDEIMDELVEHMIDGRTLHEFCKMQGHPGYNVLFRWFETYPELARRYQYAREIQADRIADELLSVADDPDIPSDQKKHMLDARKWVASKLKPKSYGDRIELNAKVEHEYSVSALLRSLQPSPLVPARILAEQRMLAGRDQVEDAELVE